MFYGDNIVLSVERNVEQLFVILTSIDSRVVCALCELLACVLCRAIDANTHGIFNSN